MAVRFKVTMPLTLLVIQICNDNRDSSLPFQPHLGAASSRKLYRILQHFAATLIRRNSWHCTFWLSCSFLIG